MEYRVGKKDEYTKIAAYLDQTDYYDVFDIVALGGHWLIAEHEGKIHGTVWFFAAQPNAYLDYWAADHGRTAINLMLHLDVALRAAGIRYVRGMVHKDNDPAIRLLSAYPGAEGYDNYMLAYKELPHGEDHPNTD